MTKATPLRLAALDAEDLQIISAHTQDAVMRVESMAFRPKSQRFTVILSRFNWEKAGPIAKRKGKKFERRQAALNFDRVNAVKVQNINTQDQDAVVELLAINFDETSAPAGHITLIFAGGGAIRMDVECIEVQLDDLGAAWQTKNLPEHALDDFEESPSEDIGS